MKRVSRRTAIGLVSATVVVAMTGVTTWAVAGETTDSSPVRLVVGLKAGVATGEAQRTISAAGVSGDFHDAPGKAEPADMPQATTVVVSKSRQAKVTARLKSDPNVAYVEVDRVRRLFATVNDPMFTNGYQTQLDELKVPQAWDETTGGTTIAVLDTGVARGADMTGQVLTGYNFIANNTDTADTLGHGTMVSSIIAAKSNNGVGMAGVCTDCRILPVKVMGKDGGYDSQIASGIKWAVNNGAKIINMSFGGPESTQVLSDAVLYANRKGVLVVASAGNENNTVKQYPAAYPDVLGVGGTTPGSDARIYFSSYNKAGDTWVDVAAPGYATAMDYQGAYHTGQEGTSFSSPMVAGVAGLVKAENPTYTGWSLLRSITGTARPIGSWVTWGKVDAQRALHVPTDTTKPTVTGSGYSENAKVKGTITISPAGVADNSGGSGVRNVDLYVDGKYVTQNFTAPYQLKLDTTRYSGSMKLELRVSDKAGNRTDYPRTLIADNTAPTVAWGTAPADRAKVSGSVQIGATASDTNGVNRLELLINDRAIQTDKTSPYLFTITASLQPAAMKVQIRAYDTVGNVKYTSTRNWTR